MNENIRKQSCCDESQLEAISGFFSKMREACSTDKKECSSFIDSLESCYSCSACC